MSAELAALKQHIAELEAELAHELDLVYKDLEEADKRIAELEEFVRWVRDEGSDYWKPEASALLEKGK